MRAKTAEERERERETEAYIELGSSLAAAAAAASSSHGRRQLRAVLPRLLLQHLAHTRRQHFFNPKFRPFFLKKEKKKKKIPIFERKEDQPDEHAGGGGGGEEEAVLCNGGHRQLRDFTINFRCLFAQSNKPNRDCFLYPHACDFIQAVMMCE